ncbi:MAG: acylphosphatase [Thaumarchaeota archaeon]|nr:MAG: acylphosphatase [Nitrososphaerota archaeon]
MGRVVLRVVVRGLVQGVLFRASMTEVARANRVDGWVRNRADGAVEALLEGDEGDVRKVLEWSEHGPRRARVDSVTVERQKKLRGLRGFRIVG